MGEATAKPAKNWEKQPRKRKSDYKHLITKHFKNEETSTMEIGGCNAANDVAFIQRFCSETSDFW